MIQNSNKIQKYLFFSIILVFFLIFCLIFNNFSNIYAYSTVSNFNSKNIINEINENINNIYLTNIDEVKNRTAGSTGEAKMAERLNDFMAMLELKKIYNKEDYYQSFSFGKDLTSKNVVGIIDNSSNNYVIIGAHYDSVYVANKSFGYSDNISGVVGVMSFAKMLKSHSDLNFNIIVAFYGAEEVGCEGSKYFVSNMEDKIKDNIMLSINFDSIGAGDYLYYYHSDFASKYGKCLDNILSKQSYKNAKGKYQTSLVINNMNYNTLALNSDSAPFLKKGYNSLLFFAGNCDNLIGYKETSKHNKIMHLIDTKETIDEVFGDDFVAKIQTVVLTCDSLFVSDEFNINSFSPNQINSVVYSDWLLKFVGFGLVNLLFIGYVIWLFKAKRFTKK